MSEVVALQRDTLEPFAGTAQPTIVTDELNRILALLREGCPAGSLISFDFDGRLHVHVDVRRREEVTAVEAALQLGLFTGIRRGATPHHPFFTRVSALVAC
jgi:hypothetical protein